MMEQWTPTKDARLAAAFGTLGVPIRVEKTLVERSGNREVNFLIALVSVDGQTRTKALMSGWRSGTLKDRDPAHPFLTILRAFANRLAILNLQDRGEFCRLVRVKGTQIWQYVRAETGLPGTNGVPELIETGDLKMVAALGTVGFPLLRLDGPRGSRKYFLPRYGPERLDGIELLRAWRADKESIPWEKPFAQAARGLHNRERLLDAARREMAMVLLQKPRSVKSATVQENASDAAFDQVKEFFDE